MISITGTITLINRTEMHVTTHYSRNVVTYKVASNAAMAEYYKIGEEINVLGTLRDGWIANPEISHQDERPMPSMFEYGE